MELVRRICLNIKTSDPCMATTFFVLITWIFWTNSGDAKKRNFVLLLLGFKGLSHFFVLCSNFITAEVKAGESIKTEKYKPRQFSLQLATQCRCETSCCRNCAYNPVVATCLATKNCVGSCKKSNQSSTFWNAPRYFAACNMYYATLSRNAVVIIALRLAGKFVWQQRLKAFWVDYLNNV